MKINFAPLKDKKFAIPIAALTIISFCCGIGVMNLAINKTPTEQIQVITREVTQKPLPTYTMYPTFTSMPMTPTPSTFVELYRFSGTGSQSTKMFGLQNGIARITWKYTGESNFIAKLWLLSTGEWESLANEIGSVRGVSMINVVPGNDYMIEVEHGSGQWEFVIEHKPLR